MDETPLRTHLARNALIVAAFALYLSATFLQPMEVFGVGAPERLVLSLTKSLTVIGAALYTYHHKQDVRMMCALAVTCMLVAVALLGVGGTAMAVALVANVLAGASSGFILMTIAALGCSMTPNRSLAIVLAYLVAAFVAPVLGLLMPGPAATQIATYGLMLVLIIGIVWAERARPVGYISVAESVSRYRSPNRAATLIRSIFRLDVLLTAAGAWLLSFSFGVLESTFLSGGIDRAASYRWLEATMIVVVFVYLVLATFRKGLQASRLFTFACVLFLVTYIGVMLISGVTGLLYTVMYIGLTVYYLQLWMTMSDEAVEHQVPATFVFGLLVTGPIALVRMVGTLVPVLMESVFGVEPTVERLVIVVLVVVLAAIMALVLAYAHTESQLGAAEVSEQPDEAEDVYNVISRTYGLTERESQVLGSYAIGRSASHIASELNVSQFTVKEYVRRIYAKLDVHNRQELIDFVERAGDKGSAQ